jgi:hypothetical protein
MSTQTWIVHVDGAQREVFVDTDPATGRTALRVDGRMAGRPMSSAEDEREIAVGSERFIIRRMAGGAFDLDKAPPDAASIAAARNGTAPPRRTPAAAAVKTKSQVPVGKIISAVLVTIVLAVVVPYVKKTVAYFKVPWQTYVHSDRSFRVNIVGKPETKGGKLLSRYRDHAYVLEWIDAGGVIPVENERRILDGALSSIVKTHSATLVNSEYAARHGRGAKTFTAQFPEQKGWSRGTVRGEIIVDASRVYFLWAFTPQGESLSFDVGEYLRSFELPR